MNELTPMIIDGLRPGFAILLLERRVGSPMLATRGPAYLRRRLGGRNET